HGIYLNSAAFNNTIYDNNITTNNMTSSYGVYLENNVNNNTFFRNKITSLSAGIVVNGTGQTASQTTRFNTFTNDTIIPCSVGCAANYQDVILTANATDLTFTNVSFNKSRVALIPRSPDTPIEINNLTVRWFLSVNITNSTNNLGIANAQANINDSFANNLFNLTADASGATSVVEVTEYTQNGTVNFTTDLDTCTDVRSNVNITCFSPYNISVNITGYNPNSASIDVNRSKFVNISMTLTPDTTAPIVNTSFNVSSPVVNDVINFSGNITDGELHHVRH
ncbi:hypothetical protein J4234_06945, partial [Candidatus Woesearchaeota archaeon]|nr:hypothetical protein [Candidatus Woesearchaeota archaeon]